eukprot:1660425-Amphidinium_carterae.1
MGIVLIKRRWYACGREELTQVAALLTSMKCKQQDVAAAIHLAWAGCRACTTFNPKTRLMSQGPPAQQKN